MAEQQRHPCHGLIRNDVDHRLARREHLGLRVENGQIARQARAVALLGQPVGGLVGLQGLLLFHSLARQGVDAGELIRRLLYGAQHGVVVAVDRSRPAAPRCS